jgi:transglutaminase-like putative cysteine protease
MPSRVVDGEGVIAIRVTAAEAAIPFSPVDLIAATSIPLTGTPSHRLVLEGDLALPPVPGQAPRVARAGPDVPDGPHGADRIELELSARLRGGLPPGAPGPDRTREIAALVARVRRRIAPDLAADPTSGRTAADATAGDCTTFALAYAALAGDRGIPTLVVTGFRIDGDRLVRHRWAVSWTGRAWIAVDAAFGAVPAGGDLVGLAIHDADDVGLVAGEAALTHLRAATWK